jgi:Acyl-CoA carboxylase epsilon subunit
MSEATLDESMRTAAQMRVMRGAPDEFEVAALVAGLAAVASSSGSEDEAIGAMSQWNRRLRGAPGASLAPGADSWRWSLR